ncbi:MAG: sensor histidine kinase [Fusobacteriaceae bacterium]
MSNIIFLDQFYIYRKKKMMLEIIKIAKDYTLKNEEKNLDEYIYKIKELEGVEVNIDKKSLRMSRSNMMSNHMSMTTKIPLNQFYKNNLPGVGALILYYGEKLPDGRNIYVSTSLSVMNAHKHETNIFNFLTGIFALIFSILAGAFFSKKITKDISLLSKTAEKIAKLDFPKNIAIHRKDEIGDLSKSLEKMSLELSNSINNLKSFVSTASHELRTPISVLISYSKALLENKFENEAEEKKYKSIILKEVLEMRELIENLLTISKLDALDYKSKKENINFLEILKDSIDKYDFLELEKELEVNLNIQNSFIMSDKKLLKLAFDNIIQNAFRYSPQFETIDIFQKENYLFIKNKINTENKLDAQHLLQPFVRGKNAEDMEVDGMGLGLSIIKKALLLNETDFDIEINEHFFIIKLKF